MTQALQLLVAAGVAIGLAVFALHRDKKEHADERQSSIYFPKQQEQSHRGAAMSQLR